MNEEYLVDPENEVLNENETTDDWDNHIGDNICF